MCNPLNSSTLKYKRTLSVTQAEALFFIMPSKGKSRTGWGSKESPLRSIPGAIVVVKPHSQSRPKLAAWAEESLPEASTSSALRKPQDASADI